MSNLLIKSLFLWLLLTVFSSLLGQALSFPDFLRIHESEDSLRKKILLSHGFQLSESAMKELNGALVPTDYYTWQSVPSEYSPIQTMVVVRNPHPQTRKRMESSYIFFSENDYKSLQLAAWAWGYKYVKETKEHEQTSIICENTISWLRFFVDKYPDNHVVYGITIEDK